MELSSEEEGATEVYSLEDSELVVDGRLELIMLLAAAEETKELV